MTRKEKRICIEMLNLGCTATYTKKADKKLTEKMMELLKKE